MRVGLVQLRSSDDPEENLPRTLSYLEEAAQSGADLILTDWNMPKVNGLQFIQNVKARGFKDVPIIMVTTEAEKAIDAQDTTLNLDSDFSADELQAELDQLSDLSVLDTSLDEDAQPASGAEPPANLGLVEEDVTTIEEGLDQPIDLDEATTSVLFVVTNLSSRLPDADEPDGSERAFELVVDRAD